MPPKKGYHQTPEHRARISAALTGRAKSAETLAKRSASRKGFRHTDESRKKISESVKKTKTPELRARVGASIRARMTPEARLQMSLSRKGRPVGEQHRLHLSESWTPERREKHRTLLVGNTFNQDASIKGECIYCFEPAQTYDHVIPRGRLGADDPENLLPACRPCNSSKGDRTPEEWLMGDGE